MVVFCGRVGRSREELVYVIGAGASAKCGRPVRVSRAVVVFKSSRLL
jgi:hypothetical protein